MEAVDGSGEGAGGMAGVCGVWGGSAVAGVVSGEGKHVPPPHVGPLPLVWSLFH